jgi:HEAT repeat protein
LIALLGDEATVCRFTVKDSLLRLGPAASELLREFLATASGAAAAAGLEVAAALRDPRLLEPAFRLLDADDPTVRCRAIDAIGALGGERAAYALIARLDDPAAEVRAAAARALGHGRHWIAGAKLAGALRDRSWEVRRQAGLALRRLGAPGELLLRRMLADEDRFAGHMARLMLDLPFPPA